MKRRKPIAYLLSACQRMTCGTRARPNSAAGRRGRRRSAYEAPRAAADRGTPLGGAESKRRRRPRLPAPPSRVTHLATTPAAEDGARAELGFQGADALLQVEDVARALLALGEGGLALLLELVAQAVRVALGLGAPAQGGKSGVEGAGRGGEEEGESRLRPGPQALEARELGRPGVGTRLLRARLLGGPREVLGLRRLLPRGALQACVLPLEGCGPLGQRARRRVRDVVDEAGAHLGGVADPVGGEEGGHVTRGDTEHLGDDPRVVARSGPVEEGLPVLAQREQRLGGGGPDRQEECRGGEEADALRA